MTASFQRRQNQRSQSAATTDNRARHESARAKGADAENEFPWSAAASTGPTAARENWRAFDALLGSLEFMHGLGGFTIHYGPGGKAITHFPRPRWVIAVSKSKQVLLSWFESEGDAEEKKSKPVTVDGWIKIISNLRLLRKKPSVGSVESVVGDGLRLYAQALDAKVSTARLAGFWQALEALTLYLSERFGGKTEAVCHRSVAFPLIWKVDQEAMRMALLGIAPIRNRIVHNGSRLGRGGG